MITDGDMPAGYRLVIATSDSLRIVDRVDDELQIVSELEQEELWFYVNTDDRDGNKRTVRGRMLYDLMMRHFGLSVVAIAGFWSSGENRRIFIEALNGGATPEDAALSTWSGRQAERHGFSQVEFDWSDWPEIPQTLGVRFRRKDGAI